MSKVIMNPVTGSSVLVSGSGNLRSKVRGLVALYDAGKTVGWIFVTDEDPLPQDYADTTGTIYMYVPTVMMSIVIDTLRNEKVLYICFWESDPPGPTFAALNGSPPSNLTNVKDLAKAVKQLTAKAAGLQLNQAGH
jgi:hypothetical protein